jgi:hypothetical protein
MHWQPTSRAFRLRVRCAVLGVLAALASSAALAAPPPKDDAGPVNPPLFVPTEIQPIHLAALTFTAPITPRVGPWTAAADVYAGAHPDAQVWTLRGAFSTRPGRTQAGAASLFLAGFGPNAGLTELGLLQAGDVRDCWTLINTDELRPFPEFFLKQGLIRDRKDLYNGAQEIDVFCQILAMAHFTSAKAFAKAARHDVTYAHLFNEPEHHRGQVIHLTGRLVRLRRFDPPPDARGAGVGDLYEGWIMTDRYGENPACVVFTDLPASLKIEDDRRLNIEGVSIDGYFYKRYRYKAYDSKKHNEFRDAPLLIGHTLRGPFGPGTAAEPPADDWGKNLMFGFLSVVGGAAVGVVGLTFWFRYHDRRVRRRLMASRDMGFVPPSPPEEFLDESGEAQANGNGDSAEKPEKQPFSHPRWSDFPQAPN